MLGLVYRFYCQDTGDIWRSRVFTHCIMITVWAVGGIFNFVCTSWNLWSWFVSVNWPLVRNEAASQREGVCRFYSERWLPSAFHLVPSNTPTVEQECLLTHKLLSTRRLPLFFPHAYKGFATNCSHLSLIWTDTFVLFFIWLSPHCLASFVILKTRLLSLSRPTSRWWRSCLAAAEVMWKLLSSLSAYSGDNAWCSALCTETISHIYRVTHLLRRCKIFFYSFCSTHSPLAHWWCFSVNLHVINNCVQRVDDSPICCNDLMVVYLSNLELKLINF